MHNQQLNTDMNLKLQGRFRLMVRNKETDEVVRDTGWFENLILDAGLNRMGTGAPISGCAIGTGTSTPTVSDTGLQSLAAWTTTTTTSTGYGNEGAPNYVSFYECGYRFNAGSLNGNYAEIGMGWGSTTMFSRARIVDGLGNPTTISVLSTEYLDVFYMLRVIPDLNTYTSSVVVSGITYSVDRKPANVSSTSVWRPLYNGAVTWVGGQSGSYPVILTNGSLGAVTGSPSGTTQYPSANTTSGTYVGNSYERTGSFTIGLASGNLAGGIKSVQVLGTMCSYQFEFTPALPKDNTKQLVLNGKVTWARV